MECLKLWQDSAVGQWLFLEAVRPEAISSISKWALRQVETHGGRTAYLAAPPPVCQMAGTLVPSHLPTPNSEADASGCRVSPISHRIEGSATIAFFSLNPCFSGCSTRSQHRATWPAGTDATLPEVYEVRATQSVPAVRLERCYRELYSPLSTRAPVLVSVRLTLRGPEVAYNSESRSNSMCICPTPAPDWGSDGGDLPR